MKREFLESPSRIARHFPYGQLHRQLHNVRRELVPNTIHLDVASLLLFFHCACRMNRLIYKLTMQPYFKHSFQ